jgi:mRNA interferase MazF
VNDLVRGAVVDIDFPDIGRRPAVVVTRNTLLPLLTSVIVARVTSMIRGLRTEVAVGIPHGLDQDSVVNCTDVFTVPKGTITKVRGTLGPVELRQLDLALRIALELD